jgi:hypothetical protein
MVLQRNRAKAELGKGSFWTVYLTQGRRDEKSCIVKDRPPFALDGRNPLGRERLCLRTGPDSSTGCARGPCSWLLCVHRLVLERAVGSAWGCTR